MKQWNYWTYENEDTACHICYLSMTYLLLIMLSFRKEPNGKQNDYSLKIKVDGVWVSNAYRYTFMVRMRYIFRVHYSKFDFFILTFFFISSWNSNIIFVLFIFSSTYNFRRTKPRFPSGVPLDVTSFSVTLGALEIFFWNTLAYRLV